MADQAKYIIGAFVAGVVFAPDLIEGLGEILEMIAWVARHPLEAFHQASYGFFFLLAIGLGCWVVAGIINGIGWAFFRIPFDR